MAAQSPLTQSVMTTSEFEYVPAGAVFITAFSICRYMTSTEHELRLMYSASHVLLLVAFCDLLHQLMGLRPENTIHPVVLRWLSFAFQSASQYATSLLPPYRVKLITCVSFDFRMYARRCCRAFQ